MLNDQKLMKRGLAKLREIDGGQGDQVMQALADIAPDLGKYIIAFGFGEIYNRPQLDSSQRELITLAALTAQGGCEKQLQVHIHAALNVGIKEEQIIETFIHCVPYLGFPKALNAVFTAKTVFAEKRGEK
ncbi:carboxymuconolactone decarboxylase family protein [Bisgaard Taxon 10/6]|uniref:carboxymuconolactone decarboxylase family protein n=1 Tax=Exercitatus varius TaxID=67857 RepID=UPI00294AC6EA|nr:carboxymuconolactone decarboxylase family protein [Exercitatus varius]MDG2916070.1 carboxymuconolactone decarboxylase family protein [Exercitatus varius]MDG2958187.1 carboxymuconolactone decarboxylase family protein [Exercitatus varius]MDG2959295.1 carboxymuconolactone decarboxylase family protein [Exercitatus varius]